MNKSTNHQYGDKVPGAVGARAKRPVPVVVGGDTVLSIRSYPARSFFRPSVAVGRG